MHPTKNWYVVYTRAGLEKKVTDILSRKKIENYCPLTKVVTQSGSGKRLIQKPLFTSHIFARVFEREIPYLKTEDGVLSLLFWLDKPAVIPDSEIAMIREFLNEHPAATLKKLKVNPHYVQSVSGNNPFMTEENPSVVKSKTSDATLGWLGYQMVPDPEPANTVEVITQPLLQRLSRNWNHLEQKLLHAIQID